ncbi:Hypothetical predicted protein [Mytilus galloprovincialis]|uniref:Reverse transcriptase domain-containing protein n=1 Tax=Mytilus galloprovincialis TaxID=29158 RepID=A0A8B6DFH1_MYTGA|nr:Hypothetical predicted protein [Mytilus galloprovincialis]
MEWELQHRQEETEWVSQIGGGHGDTSRIEGRQRSALWIGDGLEASTQIGGVQEWASQIGDGMGASTQTGGGQEWASQIGDGMGASTQKGGGQEWASQIGNGMGASKQIGGGHGDASQIEGSHRDAPQIGGGFVAASHIEQALGSLPDTSAFGAKENSELTRNSIAPTITRRFSTHFDNPGSRVRRSVDICLTGNNVKIGFDINLDLTQEMRKFSSLRSTKYKFDNFAITPIIIMNKHKRNRNSGHDEIINKRKFNITFQTDGCSYSGRHLDYISIDERTRSSESIALIAFEKPISVETKAYVRVYDSNGVMCQPSCLVSKSTYKGCSGLIKITSDNPQNHYSRKTNVRHVESADDTCSEPDYENEDDDYAFTVHGNQGKVSKFTVNVGGIDVPVVIDSGATVNIIDRTLWEHLKKNKIKCESKTSSKNLYADGVGKLVDFQLKIPIDKSIQPVIQPLRRIPYHLRGKLEEKLNELVEQDIIEAVNGPSQWTSPIVVVPKKNGDIRICVDMRRANLAVMRERYPIPTVDEVIQDLNQSKVFSKLDIKLAYHQIELTPESRQITCFMTHKGIFRYKRLMFGINCAPEMYNKVMSQVFQGLEGVRNIFDDVVVYGSTSNEHNDRLDAVLQRLEERGLTLNIVKCKFNMANIEFMGHMLSEHGIGVSQSKVEAIVNARRPESVSEIRSFLGLVNFVGRFIPNLATVAEPLHRLLHKETKFQWGPEQNDSFEKLKKGLVDASDLSYFSLKAKTQVIADASPVGLGAVLVQKQNDEYKVICYASRSLTTIERKYSQTEKEALGLVWACERFHMYLLGHDFELLTDHRPLEFIFSPKSKPCARVERWMLRMQPFKYVVKYIPGSQNIADSLSRLLVVPKNESKQGEINQAEEYIRFVASESTPNAVKIEDVDKMLLNDKEL